MGNKIEKAEKKAKTVERRICKLTDEFKDKQGKEVKNPKKTDTLELDDSLVLLIDSNVEFKEIKGKASLFVLPGKTLKINGKRRG